MTDSQVPGVRVRPRRGGWRVTVDRVHDLQRLAVASIGGESIGRLEVEVRRWKAPVAGWLGAPRLPGVSGLAVEVRDGGVMVDLRASAPDDPGRLLAGVVRLLAPAAFDEGPELTFAPGLPPSGACLAARIRDLVADERDLHVRRCDVLVSPAGSSLDGPERAVTVMVGDRTWVRDGQSREVSVDPTLHRPIGRRSVVTGVVATATTTGERVHLVAPGARIQLDGDLGPAHVAALRGIDAVVGDVPDVVARQLHACGILTAVSVEGLPDPDDPLGWQAASVHERRHALRAYGPTVAVGDWPTVSVLLVTHRAEHLEHAIGQLARLRYPRMEVVLGAHGPHVDGARMWELAQGIPYPTTVVAVDGARTLGEALQECTNRAGGSLVTKMDDDDHYGPEHVWDLVLARQYSGAQVVGKALDWIHLQAQDVTAFRPTYAAEKYADFVAGGTMLISRADLAAVGGWRPVPKSVDRALLDRVLLDGGLVYRTHGLGYVYVRRGEGHTASVRDEHFLTKTTATLPGLVQHACFGTGGDPE